VVAVDTISLSVAFMAGPLIIGATGVEGWLPFLIAAGLMAAGVVPILWGLSALPQATPETPPTPASTVRFFATDPLVVWGVVLFGTIEYGSVALLPVWAVRDGFAESQAVMVAASFAAGSIVFAPLLGWAGDRLDRRRLLGAIALACVAAPAGLVWASPSLWGVILVGMVWGGLAVGLYTLALVELGARYSGARLAEANAAVVLGYGIGALVSPVALGEAMDRVPPDGMLWLSAILALGYAGLAAVRLAAARRRAP
jgi:MFS family permease